MKLAASEDQVPRLQAFKEAHPDIKIIAPTRFQPSWAAKRSDEPLVSRLCLRNFLDELNGLVSGK
jgi:hypothetical protein